MDPRTRIEFISVDIQLFIVSNKTCNKENSLKVKVVKKLLKESRRPLTQRSCDFFNTDI